MATETRPAKSVSPGPSPLKVMARARVMLCRSAVASRSAAARAGVASSTIGFLQQFLGAAAVQWMGHFPTDTALPMLVFCAVACLLGLGMLYVFPRVEAGNRELRYRATR